MIITREAVSLELRWVRPVFSVNTLRFSLFTAMGFYGHIGAIEYISIGLAAMLFFTFPPVIAVLQAVVLKKPPGTAKTVALLRAFNQHQKCVMHRMQDQCVHLKTLQ